VDYNELVREARGHLGKIEFHKSMVAKLALSACTIKHGGKSTGFYTLTDFAKDIGMNFKTLSNWVQIQRDVLDRVGIENPTKNEFDKASKAVNYMRIERRINNEKNGTENSKKEYNSGVTAKHVMDIFNRVETDSKVTLSLRLRQLTKNLVTIIKHSEFHELSDYEKESAKEDIRLCWELINQNKNQGSLPLGIKHK
jgi:hypothetical protein